MNIVNLEKPISTGAQIKESRLQARLNPRNFCSIYVSFCSSPGVRFYLELNKLFVFNDRNPALLGVHGVNKHVFVHSVRPESNQTLLVLYFDEIGAESPLCAEPIVTIESISIARGIKHNGTCRGPVSPTLGLVNAVLFEVTMISIKTKSKVWKEFINKR
jgi:hypothetical protein